MTGKFLFEIESQTPRKGARKGRPAAATTNPMHANIAPGPVGVGVRDTAAGPLPASWVLEIPAPTINKRNKKTGLSKPAPGWLNMNNRIHRRQRDHLVSEWRKAAGLVARHNKLPVGVVTRARFDAVLRFTATVRRDPVNWHPTVKPILDALTKGTRTYPGYGFLPDDSPAFLHCEDCPHLRIGELLPRKAFGPLGMVVLTITPLEVGEVAA